MADEKKTASARLGVNSLSSLGNPVEHASWDQKVEKQGAMRHVGVGQPECGDLP